MSLDVGFASQAPSLPKGGASMAGLGETFAPDLSTGTGSLAIPLDCPNGPSDIGPRMALRYDTAAANGIFGYGFSLPLPRLLRSTGRGYPRYDATDILALEGVGELVALADGAFRPRVDAGGWRARKDGDGFRVTDREGRHYFLGASAASRLADPADAGRVYAWHLERIEDALGNEARFVWQRHGGQLYLATVAYGAYEARFTYEPRPDPVRWGRAGFTITTAQRCARIELHLSGAAASLLRRWSLSYVESAGNGASLLTKVELSGFDASGNAQTAPPLTLGYSESRPRNLVRFTNIDEGAAPGALRRTDRRVELIDWNGDGLPDLIEIAPGGHARLWPNLGDYTWGRPQNLGAIPLFAATEALVGLADMTGDGVSDLVRLDRPMSGYIPRRPGGGFDRRVTWRQAPAIAVADARARFVDLDGDGMVDLLTSRQGDLSLYYREEPHGWSPQPQVVPRAEAPPVDLADPRVFVADMTGDGSAALVRVDGSGVTYWPYLGRGRWDAPVRMQPSPELPFDVRPDRLFFSDVDGDGCADLIYLGGPRLLYWHNRAGQGFSEPRIIDYIPNGRLRECRLADMRGNGTSGVLWSMGGPLGRGTEYFYLDFTGDTKPYLLNRIDNGVGLVTTIEYSTSSAEAARDARAGQPWTTFLPLPVAVVSSLGTRVSTTGRSSLTTYRYHDGRYDGVLREFAGFGRVEQDEHGDASIPTLRTTTWFHNGVDPEQPTEPQTTALRHRRRAIRGRIYRQERHGLDGSPAQDMPYDRLEQKWIVVEDGDIMVPRLSSSVRTTFERAAAPAAVLTTNNVAWDEHGNLVESAQTSEAPGDPTQTRMLRNVTLFAEDPARRFLGKPWRVRQFDGTTVIADTITEYDHAPEGRVGPQGLITGRKSLAFTDSLASAVYGSDLPDFAALGYHRRADQAGWWIQQAAYQRIDDASGLRGSVRGPLGGVTELIFDASRTTPERVTDALGNVVQAVADPRVFRVRELTDANGAARRAEYDALSRLVAIVDPGDSAPLPTLRYEYMTATLPVERLTRQRAVSGAPETIDTREIFDSADTVVERRIRDDAGEIVVESTRLNARALVERMYVEHRPASVAYTPPTDATAPHTRLQYDALGRLVRKDNPDGSAHSLTYGPLTVIEADEEDTRRDAGATHSVTPMRITFFPTGHVRAIEEDLGGRLLRSRYEYDVKGDLVSHEDAQGRIVRIAYDLLGRRMRVARPEQTIIHVLDPAGNEVETRGAAGRRAFRTFDVLGRLVSIRHGAPTSAPVARVTYHDAGTPAPPEAGAHTRGRAVRVDDDAGVMTMAYDARGQVVGKQYHPLGAARSYEVELAYRADGQVAEIRYPHPDGGGARTTLRYEYDRRGLLSAIPSLLDSVAFDLAGRRTRVRFANGAEQEYAFDAQNGRLRSMTLRSGVVERIAQFRHDRVGNLVAIESPDPTIAMTFRYDDLYRLTAADSGDGLSWTYRYSDAGDLTFKSDVGDYLYGEDGAPATCLTSAGGRSIAYTANGEIEQASWGKHAWDAEGRLVRVEAPDGTARVDFAYNYLGTRVAEKSTGRMPELDRLTPDALFSIEGGQLVLNLFDGSGVAACETAGVRRFLHPDHLGGLAVVTDAAAAVIDRRRYDPYGQLLQRTGASPAAPFDFNGGVLDASGLLYLQTRYYHPVLGRFISPDTVVAQRYQPASWASYAFCSNNPVSYADPTGENAWAIFGFVALFALYVMVSVATLGMAAPLATGLVASVSVGIVSGGVVGGLAAGSKGGDIGDVLAGVLVGAAVGGWSAFAGFYVSSAIATYCSCKYAFINAVTAGAASGGITGTAIGFASGFAGGKGTLDEIMKNMLAGFAIGALTGGATSVFAKPLTITVKMSRSTIMNGAVAFAAGAFGEGLTQLAQDKEANWLKIVASGLVLVGFGSVVNAESGFNPATGASEAGAKSTDDYIFFAGSASIPAYNHRYLGVVSSVSSSVSAAIFLRTPVNPGMAAVAVTATKGY
jgi:RHS repeat-associated protein